MNQQERQFEGHHFLDYKTMWKGLLLGVNKLYFSPNYAPY